MATARTPLDHWHRTHGARLTEAAGWQVPVAYSSPEQEVAAAGAGLGLADVSAFARLSLLGRGVATFTRAVVGEGPAGQPRGVTRCSIDGPALACRLSNEHLLLLALTFAPQSGEVGRLAAEHGVLTQDVTSAHACFCLIGRSALEVLRRLTSLDVTAQLPAATCAETSVAEVHAVLVRPAELAAPAVYVCVAADLGEYVWERLLAAGRAFGMLAVGVDAARILTAG